MSEYEHFFKHLSEKDKHRPMNEESLYRDFLVLKHKRKQKYIAWFTSTAISICLVILAFIFTPRTISQEQPTSKVAKNTYSQFEKDVVHKLDKTAIIDFDENHQWQIKKDSEIRVKQMNAKQAIVELLFGEIKISRESQATSGNLIHVNNLEITEVGTQYKVLRSRNKLFVAVISGEVKLTDSKTGLSTSLKKDEHFENEEHGGSFKLPQKVQNTRLKEFKLTELENKGSKKKAWVKQNQIFLARSTGPNQSYTLPKGGKLKSLFVVENSVFLVMEGEKHYFKKGSGWTSQKIGGIDAKQVYSLRNKQISVVNKTGNYYLYSLDGQILHEEDVGIIPWRGVVFKDRFLILPSLASELKIIDHKMISAEQSEPKLPQTEISSLKISAAPTGDILLQEELLVVPTKKITLKINIEDLLSK